ncbi:MAG: Fibroin heavy chain precursor [Deltaproteobacteria bacterium]|nr:Fibroin heavy chain precursor [Deltaproteobacteria bacterium]
MTRSRVMKVVSALVFACAFAGLLTPADAHFKLNSPASLSEQDLLGGPQKSAPCGLSDSAGTPDESVPTNIVTTVQSGSMLTIKFNETIFHPGHYRVAIAQDIGSLPADPPVTAGSTACGSTQIDANPTLPLLGDGLLVHTSAFSGEQTAQVQLPAGMTCTNCVLQVVQFMSDHGLNNPGGCFYHHCATVTISNNAPPPDAAVAPGDDAGTTPPDDPASGCCSTHRDAGSAGLFGAGVLGLMLLRRRRR